MSACSARTAAQRFGYARLRVPGEEPFCRKLRSAAPAACCTQRLETPATTPSSCVRRRRRKRAGAVHLGARGCGRHVRAVTPALPRTALSGARGSCGGPLGTRYGGRAAFALGNALGCARRACTG